MTAIAPVDPALRQRMLSLAPTHLDVAREDRFDGGGFDASLAHFAPEDIRYIRTVYEATKTTYELWLYMREAPNHALMRKQLIDRFTTPEVVEAMNRMGQATIEANNETPDALRKVLHDIRGGALMGLTGYVSLLAQLDPPLEERNNWIEGAAIMTRDHAKLMRNALPDLDPIVREADESLKVHKIDDFVRKWHGARLNHGNHTANVQVHCDFVGSVTNRCLETSAIDRVLYNYLNNATRFAEDGSIDLGITAINSRLVRWVVSNRITPDHAAWLREHVGEDLSILFRDRITRGGQGIGLNNCADFVGASCGYSPRSALDQGFLGARLVGDIFHAWFHWPSYDSSHKNLPDCPC